MDKVAESQRDEVAHWKATKLVSNRAGTRTLASQFQIWNSPQNITFPQKVESA